MFFRILKHVVFLIKLVNPFKLQNSPMDFLFVVALKPHKNKKLWYIFLYSPMMRLRLSKWFDMKLLLGFHELLMRHFLFLKFTSTQIDSMLQSDLSLRNFEDITSRIYNKRPLTSCQTCTRFFYSQEKFL